MTVNEKAGTATFTVTLSAASGLPVSVAFATSPGTATAPADYTSTSGTLSFAPGVTSQTITVPILDDTIFEQSESFTVTLSAPVNATISDATGIGTIRDDGTGAGGADNDTPTLSVTDVPVTEGTNTHAVFAVSLSNISTVNVSVALALANGSALGGGVDYGTAGAGNLQVSTDNGTTWNDATTATITAGTTSVLVRTPIVIDALDENAETFTLTATRTAGITSNASALGTATITDNDPTPSLFIDDVVYNEGAGTMTFTVTLSAASGLPVAVNFATSDGTATAPGDYTSTNGTVIFAPGVTSQTIHVAILDDSIFEQSENFTVTLSNASNATIADATGIGTIRDDGTGAGGTDDDTPALTVSNVTVTEGTDTHAVFEVDLSNPSTTDVSFSLALADGTATGGGVDFGPGLEVSTDGGTNWNSATSATIAAGKTSLLVRTPIINDLLSEAPETFTLIASRTAGTVRSTPGPAGTAVATGTGTILDNDPLPGLTINDVTVNEGAGTATFTVNLSAASGQTVTVNYATSNGTATSADFETNNGSLTFAPGVISQTITVVILDDEIFENSESFNVLLSAAVNATITDGTGVGTILDNGQGAGGVDDDTPALSVSNVTDTEGADGFAVFDVHLSLVSTTDVSVALALANGTATGGGVDFGPGLEVSTDGGTNWNAATRATIAAGKTSVLVRTPIIDDTLNEAPETFTLTATRSAGTTSNAAATGTGTILDNDTVPSLSISDLTVNEGTGTALFTVTLSAPSGQTVRVNYATSSGTATSGADFGPELGVLIFNPGQTVQTIPVEIVNDSTFELSETFNVTLSAPVNATIANGAAVGTILDDGTGAGGTDDDRPNFSVSNVAVTEGTDAFAVFTVGLSNLSTTNVVVGLALADGTATGGGVDYGTAGAGNLQVSTDGGTTWADALTATIAAGKLSVLVRTPITDDLLNEAAEAFTLTATRISGVTKGSPNANSTAMGTATITDNDAVPSLSINDVTVNEAAGTATFTVALSATSGRPVTVNYATNDGSAGAGLDYTGATGVLTFAPGESSHQITVPISNDAIFENSETFNVVLSGPVNATILDGTGVGTIRDDGTGLGGTDNDTPTLSITNVTVTEGTETHAVFELNLSNASTTDVTAALVLANGTAVGGGVDFGTAGAGNLQVSTDGGTTWVNATSATITAGTTSVLVRTPIIDDLLDENAEAFTLTATRTAGTTVNASVAGTATILDNDPPPRLSINDVTVNEGAGTATFTVSLNTASGLPVSVNYSMTNGTAGAADYTAGSGTLNFAAGVTTQTIVVPILDDTLDELNETFTVNLASPTNASIEDGTGIGTIVDNDAPPSLSINDVTVNEGAGTATFTVSLSTASGLAVSVDYATANGTALDGSDYNRASGTLNFAAGETTKTFTVPILDDAIDEQNETFTATLSNPSATATIADATGTATITDNDASPTLSIGDVAVNEGAGTATFTVTLSAASGLPVSVNFATSSGTATSGSDFTAATGTLNFAAGETTKTFVVDILNDTIFEQSENFNVTLSAPVNATIADGAGLGTILDDGTGDGGTNNDTPVLLISDASGTEQANTFEIFSVFLSNLSTTPVSFSLALADVTALGGGVDYGTAGAGNLQVSTDGGATWADATAATIAPGTTSVFVRTPIVNDSLDENLELFTLTATRTAGITANFDATGTGTITDNDPPPSLSIDDVTVNEGAGTATFTVSLSTASGLPVSVDYSITDGTAGATDYTAGSGTLNFAAGVTTQTITVPILEDTLDELDETFTVNLANARNATIEDGTGIGTIVDNDAPPTLSIGDVTVNETALTATFTVTLSAASSLPVGVAFATSNGTATSGADYTAANGTLNFAAGVTTQTITVPILEDTLNEANETFTVNLANPTNATIADGTGVGTITDNDAPPALSINNVTRNEGAGSITFTVSLNAPSGQAVSVGYAATSGTATSGVDFAAGTNPLSGTLNFAAGVTSQTVTLAILNDTTFENSESFNVTLGTPVNATILDGAGVGTILDNGLGGGATDNDTPTVSITNPTVPEGRMALRSSR